MEIGRIMIITIVRFVKRHMQSYGGTNGALFKLAKAKVLLLR